MADPLTTLSPSKQNARSTAARSTPSDKTFDTYDYNNNIHRVPGLTMADSPSPPSPAVTDYHTTTDFPKLNRPTSSHSNPPLSPVKPRSPIKYRFQDESIAANSPPGSPADSTMRFNEGLTRAVDFSQEATPHRGGAYNNLQDANTDTPRSETSPGNKLETGDTSDFDLTLGFDKTVGEDTVGDLSTISAIPADMTRFANLRNSPTKTVETDRVSPSKKNRHSVMTATPGTGQRPLQLLSRRSTSSNEDDEQTPRRPRDSDDSPTDLLNFTGQSNILIPPPSTGRPANRRSPSGRGAFPIRVNPSPSHRSQASVDRERASGRSPEKPLGDNAIPATPASIRHSMFSSSRNGLGMDLLDIDLEPMATPRSIPTVTPRELETLRSELQSRISGLEATLSGKEAEVVALKRAITDAEVRAGKASEDLHNERLEKEELASQKQDFERRSREMEEVLRELKQNAFVEEREREKLRRQGEEAEKKVEEHEVRILELTASLDTLRSDRISSPQRSNEPSTPGQALDIDTAVKNATETVARELHALYKSKHERKVADLKLSYEKRWTKQVDSLKQELKHSHDEVSRLLTERDATLSGVVPGQNEAISRMEGQVEELRRWNEETTAQKKVVEAEVAGLKSELQTVKSENEKLRTEVESERVEKGELVAQVEVFLAVSAEQEKTREKEREKEREAQEARERERQPVSPPRSDASGETNSNVAAQVASPNRNRMSAPANGIGGRARPMSMLVKPAQAKFSSGIPGPGTSGIKAPAAGNRASVYGRGNLMDGIARMGGGGR